MCPRVSLAVPAILGLMTLTACTGPYNRLHERFAADHDAVGRKLHTSQVSIVERKRKGVASIGASTSVFLSDDSLRLSDNFVYFPGDVRIPASEIDACSMVCFGPNDRNVALVLGEPGVEIAVTDSDELRRWCWSNRIPAISSKERRLWLYTDAALPAPTVSEPYQKFEEKMHSSCRGY